jgi:hypothetical protein
VLAGLLTVILLFHSVATAETLTFTTELSGSASVPPNDSGATGTAEVIFDTETKELRWRIEYSGLSGPVIAAHFHGPAGIGANAGILVPIDDLISPIEGSTMLLDAHAEALLAGQVYINIHTEAHPGGEIRGQLVLRQ